MKPHCAPSSATALHLPKQQAASSADATLSGHGAEQACGATDGTDSALVEPIEQALADGFPSLVFPQRLEDQYERDTKQARVKALQGAGVSIAFLMNLFLVTDHAMVPDMYSQALTLRVGVYTPFVLSSVWFLRRIRSVFWRELFVAQAGLLACAIQLSLCVQSQSPHALAYLVGITMVIFFSNVYSRTRFWVALPVNAVYLACFALGVYLMPVTDVALVIPIGLMLVSITAFTLYYVYTLEHEERHNYLLNQKQKILADALSKANAELELASRTDALTQVANRRHFDDHIQQLWARASQDTHAVSVLMIDIDHFKPFNDRYGHPAGDACLVKVAQALRQGLRRPGDLVARYGGEEFIAVLYKASPQQVRMAAERVRAAVEMLDIEHECSPLQGHVTISVGWACAHPHAQQASVQRLISAADEALYQAKNRGRNLLWPPEATHALSDGGRS